MEKVKAGYMATKMEREQPIWYDRKRVTILGLPWSFTRYTLTKTRLTVDVGFLNRKEEEVRLFRVTDLSFSQTLFNRICNIGSIIVTSNDATAPKTVIKNVKNAKDVKELISQTVDEARKAGRVRASEMVGMVSEFEGDMAEGMCSCTDEECI